MKIQALLLISVFVPGMALCNVQVSGDSDAALVINTISKHPNISRTEDLVLIGSMGDTVSRYISQYAADKVSLSTDEIKASLGLITLAFSHPERLTDAKKRSSQDTLRLLDQLDMLTPDVNILTAINATKTYIRSQTSGK